MKFLKSSLKLGLKLSAAAVLCAGVFSSANADNDFDVYGQISAVNAAARTITISNGAQNMEIKIMPHTKLKGDDCGMFGNDTYGTFDRDLTPGKFVKVEIFYGYMGGGYPQAYPQQGQAQNPQMQGPMVAKEVEWKCRPGAY